MYYGHDPFSSPSPYYGPSYGTNGWRLLGFYGGLMFGCWVVTQWLAWQWEYDATLEHGWFQFSGVTVYAPWKGIVWLWKGMRADSVTYKPLVKDALWVFCGAVVGVISLMWLVRVWWRGQGSERHIRGTTVLDAKGFQRKLGKSGRGLMLAGFLLPKEIITSHVLTVGSTGTGKSTVLRQTLRQFEEHGIAAIVVDPHQEFTQEFYDPRRGDVILNPLDQRCPFWSPWAEEAEAVANGLIPNPHEEMRGSERFFKEAARKLLVVMLERMGSRDPRDIPRLLTQPDQLRQLVKSSPAMNAIESRAAEQSAAVLSTLEMAVQGFVYLPHRSAREWNTAIWKRERKGWVFISFPSSHKVALLPLASMWLELLTVQINGLPIGRSEFIPIVIDELATLQRLPSLEDLLTGARKRGGAVVLGMQAVTQLQQRYGRLGATTLLSAPKTKLILRAGDPDTGDWAERAIGTHEVLRPQEEETTVFAGWSRRTGPSRYIRREETVALSSEVQGLGDMVGYLKVAGVGVTPVQIAECPLKKRCEGFIPREAAADGQTEEKRLITVPLWKEL